MQFTFASFLDKGDQRCHLCLNFDPFHYRDFIPFQVLIISKILKKLKRRSSHHYRCLKRHRLEELHLFSSKKYIKLAFIVKSFFVAAHTTCITRTPIAVIRSCQTCEPLITLFAQGPWMKLNFQWKLL